MERQIGKDIQNPKGKIAFLKDNCDAIEVKGYMKAYTPEELQEHKENLAEVSIQIDEIEAEKKEQMKQFKEKLDPLQNAKKTY